jgi:hypothetical protein
MVNEGQLDTYAKKNGQCERMGTRNRLSTCCFAEDWPLRACASGATGMLLQAFVWVHECFQAHGRQQEMMPNGIAYYGG